MTSIPPPAGAQRPPHAPSPLSQPPSSAPTQNAGPHLLSLKVMRASAPALATSEKPYYDSFDTSSIPSSSSSGGLIRAVGQGISDSLSNDLLSNRWEGSSSSPSPADTFPISNLLVLPNSFGTLYLGETFRTYLCVRNESSTPVREPSLRVEMQVGSSDPQSSHPDSNVRWHQLAHIILPQPTRYSPEPNNSEDKESESEGKPVWELNPAQPLETTLGYDIKDLLPHVLVCTVGYKAPVAQADGEIVWVERSFRKFYKFGVERSPIGVRTKVHQPRHAASVYHPDPDIRRRVELEVQVQNVTGNGASLVFNGLMLKPAPGWRWKSVDRPFLNTKDGDEKEEEKGGDMWITEGSNDLLADGDVRQYLFILTPTSPTELSEEALKGGIDMGTSPEGHAIRGDALGHLDIAWRMSIGEPGRLQTSQLVRRRVVSPPITVSPTSSTTLNPQLKTELTLQPSAISALHNIKPGSDVELGVNLAICDVSGLLLPPKPDPPVTLEEQQKGSSGDDDDDDDTPLSEISPQTARRTDSTITSTAFENITIIRTLKLALQYCTILPPPPPTSVTLDTTGGPSTPRKTPLPSRTSTPTQPASLAKSKLQANLSSLLVRNGSLSLRTVRASVDSERPDSEDTDGGGGGIGTSPVAPAVPPKTMGLAPAATIDEKLSTGAEAGDMRGGGGGGGVGEVERSKKGYPEPTLSWTKVNELYSAYVETHAQALTRPPAPSQGLVPLNFLPTSSNLAQFEGSSLIPLPPIQISITALRGVDGKLYRPEGKGGEGGTVGTFLKFHINQEPTDVGEVVRFGALRIILMSYTDQTTVGTKEGEEKDCMITLEEIPVFAEALLLPH